MGKAVIEIKAGESMYILVPPGAKVKIHKNVMYKGVEVH